MRENKRENIPLLAFFGLFRILLTNPICASFWVFATCLSLNSHPCFSFMENSRPKPSPPTGRDCQAMCGPSGDQSSLPNPITGTDVAYIKTNSGLGKAKREQKWSWKIIFTALLTGKTDLVSTHWSSISGKQQTPPEHTAMPALVLGLCFPVSFTSGYSEPLQCS